MRSALLIAAACLGGACADDGTPPDPCAGALGLAEVDDSQIPQATKDAVLHDPGPVITSTDPRYPSGALVVVRIATTDYPASPDASEAYLRRILFGVGAGAADRHVAGYYAETSGGAFAVAEGAIPPWTTMAWTPTTVNTGFEGVVERAREVLRVADVDWIALDANADGAIGRDEAQLVFLVPNFVASPPAGFASTRYLDLGTLATPAGSFDFGTTRPIIYFSIAQPGFAGEPIRGALAAVNHELGHAFFDLPDRYGNPNHAGNYDMMSSFDSNVWVHFDANDKLDIGWWDVRPRFLVGPYGKTIKLAPESVGNYFLVLVKPDAVVPPYNVDEYWVVSHRNRDLGRYDADLPELGGLAVYHVRKGVHVDGHDQVILLDGARPDGPPAASVYGGADTHALFSYRGTIELYGDDGAATGMRIQSVTKPGQDFICARYLP